MKKKILVIVGHPSKKSFAKTLAERYIKGAEKTGYLTKKLFLSEMEFDPVLHEGYNLHQKLEKDLIKAQKEIVWADHIVLFYPIWWGSPPSLLKGFIDRVFLPGFAFKYENKKLKKLLSGKTASIIVTAGGNFFGYSIIGKIMIKPISIGTFSFCGIKCKKEMSG